MCPVDLGSLLARAGFAAGVVDAVAGGGSVTRFLTWTG